MADSPRRAARKNHRPKPVPDDMRSSGDRPPRRAAAASDDASPAAAGPEPAAATVPAATAAATNGPFAEEIAGTPTAPAAHFDDDGADAAPAPAMADSPRRAARKNHRPKPVPDDMRSSGDRLPRCAAAVNNTAVQAAQRSTRSESP
jgi:hypothetical protein